MAHNREDPDLGVFESDLCAIIRAKELGKNMASVSNLRQYALHPQLVQQRSGVCITNFAQDKKFQVRSHLMPIQSV